MTETIRYAPWAPEEVDSLNAYQRCDYVHHFTCGGRHEGGGPDLIATQDGWVCPGCDYRQNWAHGGMLSGETVAATDAAMRLRKKTGK